MIVCEGLYKLYYNQYKRAHMSNTHTVRLPEELTERSAILAQATKKTKSYFIREALERIIEDLEDAYLAETAY